MFIYFLNHILLAYNQVKSFELNLNLFPSQINIENIDELMV